MRYNITMYSTIKQSCKILLFSLFFVFSLFLAQTAFAAELNLSPSSGSYNVGDTIKVRVALSSSSQAANAVSGSLSFPKDMLTLTSLSKSDSLVTLWVIEPFYSNANGTVDMEGVMLNGYSGSNGTILTMYFLVKSTGTANIKFKTSSVLANDGQGTNILTGTNQASFDISPLKVVPAAPPAPVVDTTVTPEPVVTPPENQIPVKVEVPAPVIPEYQEPSPQEIIINNLSIAIQIFVLIILFMIWGWYRSFHYRRFMRRRFAGMINTVSKSFDILDEDVKEEIQILKKIKSMKPLTKDERLLIEQLQKDIESAEKVILDDIKKSEK